MDNRNRSVDKKRVRFVSRKVVEIEDQLRDLVNHSVNGDTDALRLAAARKLGVLKSELKSLMSGPDAPRDWEN
jgi:hypothetical protein